MVETFLLPLGPRLVEACGVTEGARVLDVAAGTGNASDPRRAARRPRDGQRPHARAARGGPRPLRGAGARHRLGAGRRRAPALPRRLLRHRDVVDRRDVRAAPPGGRRRAGAGAAAGRHAGAAELDAGGHARRALRDDEALRARRRRPVRCRRRCGAARSTCAGCSAGGCGSTRSPRDELEITAFPRARDYGEHFKAYYGPTRAVRANAEKEGRAAEFDADLDAFCDEWDPVRRGRRGSPRSTC